MFCTKCNCDLPPIAKFCVRCGTRVETLKIPVLTNPQSVPTNTTKIEPCKCLICGNNNESCYSFCTKCGAALVSPVSPTVVNIASPVNTSQSRVLDSNPVPVQSYVSPLQVLNTANDNSKKTMFLDLEDVPQGTYVAGKLLVVGKNSILPSRCVKCGNPPVEPWMRVTFSWHNPGYYFFLISPILYLIVALIVRKRIKLSVPLCKAHKSIRKSRLWSAGILLVCCIPLPLIFVAYVDNDVATNVAICVGLVMFIVGLILLVLASPLRPTYISSNRAEFKGASQEFLANVGEIH